MPLDGPIRALVVARDDRATLPATLDAVLGQTRGPDEVVVVDEGSRDGTVQAVRDAYGGRVTLWALTRRGGGLHEGVRGVRTRGPGALWLVDPATVPAPDALERLAGADLGPLPAPLLLAAKVVGPDGTPHPGGLPLPEMFEKEVSLAAVARHVVHLRAARPGALLVPARALARAGEPRADLAEPAATLEWTARLLRSWDDPGFLVPGALAERRTPLRAAGSDRARALLGPAWTPTERLWNLYTLGLDATGLSPSRTPRQTTARFARAKRLKRR
jgi:hypothetical protein